MSAFHLVFAGDFDIEIFRIEANLSVRTDSTDGPLCLCTAGLAVPAMKLSDLVRDDGDKVSAVECRKLDHVFGAILELPMELGMGIKMPSVS